MTPSPYVAQAVCSLWVAHALHRVARFRAAGVDDGPSLARVDAMWQGLEQALVDEPAAMRLRVRAHLGTRERQA